jgi:methionyl-tRNA formyltransferase
MRLVMMGAGLFAEPTLEALLGSGHQVVGLVTQPDRAVGEKRGSTRQTGKGMKEIAQAHDVPVCQPESINTPEGAAQLQAWRPDLLVVAAYGQILSKETLAATARGGINVHASLLPRYRGAAPIQWAIYHGEKETGVTIIHMTTGLDAGDMLAQEKVAIGPEETAGELEARLAVLGARLALQVIEQLQGGPVRGLKQDATQATKAPKLKKEHGLIDWSRSAEQVCCQVRAMQPWPTAYTYLHRPGKPPLRIIVHRAVPSVVPAPILLSAPAGAFPPGYFFADPQWPECLFVAAGSLAASGGSVVQLLEIQPEGKRRMGVADFLRGKPLAQGGRLGGENL